MMLPWLPSPWAATPRSVWDPPSICDFSKYFVCEIDGHNLAVWPEACVLLQVVMAVPQNDVLAHPNLRAFLSHVGINSMYEVHGEPSDNPKMQQMHSCMPMPSPRPVLTPAAM